MSEIKLLVIDLDGTLCEQTAGGDAYWTAKPNWPVIEKVRKLFESGWHVTIYTARGMRTFLGGREAKRAYGKKTRKWLRDHDVPYHRLKFGKPPADLYIEDKGMTPDEFANREF